MEQTKWEYAILRSGQDGRWSAGRIDIPAELETSLDSALQALGDDGWELVALGAGSQGTVDGLIGPSSYVFKRSKSDRAGEEFAPRSF